MALTLIRSSASRLNGVSQALSKSGGYLVSNTTVCPVAITQIATLKFTHGQKYDGYPEPFKYWEKRYKWYHMMYDHTSWRMNENSKIIVVEGNMAAGKKEFAKELARNFDLKYFPPVTEEELYVKKNNNLDLRVFNEILPFSARFYDLTTFALDPDPQKSGRAALLQYAMYRRKWYRYMEGLEHLLNTGQGVVLVNSVYSDQCYVDALRDAGVIRPSYNKAYRQVRENTMPEIWRPHLFIYLDAPVSVIQERIKARNDPKEVNNKVINNEKFLKSLEKHLHQNMEIQGRTSEVMELDWEVPADEMEMDWICEEIQMLKLEAETSEDVKFLDWYFRAEDEYDGLRYLAGHPTNKDLLFKYNHQEMYCDELYWKGEDKATVEALVDNNPMFKRKTGFNEKLGDNPYLKVF